MNGDPGAEQNGMSQQAPGHALPHVVSIVLNWRRPDETYRCVRSLLDSDHVNHRVLVVDNSAGKTDIADRLVGLPVEILRNPDNLGFTGGANAGMRHAIASGANYVWLMNSDAIAAPDALSALVTAAERDPSIGLISPVIHAPPPLPDTPVFCLALQPSGTLTGDATRDPEEAAKWLRERPDETVLYGTALLVRRTLIEAIGGLDEHFFAYVEDIDYSLRCHNAGFKIAVCFEAVVYHEFKDLSADNLPHYVNYFMNRNQLLLWRKRNRLTLSQKKPVLWYFYQRLLRLERDRRDPVVANALLLGLWDGLLGRGGPYDPERRAPWWLLRTLGRHPGPFINLLERKLPWRPRPS